MWIECFTTPPFDNINTGSVVLVIYIAWPNPESRLVDWRCNIEPCDVRSISCSVQHGNLLIERDPRNEFFSDGIGRQWYGLTLLLGVRQGFVRTAGRSHCEWAVAIVEVWCRSSFYTVCETGKFLPRSEHVIHAGRR